MWFKFYPLVHYFSVPCLINISWTSNSFCILIRWKRSSKMTKNIVSYADRRSSLIISYAAVNYLNWIWQTMGYDDRSKFFVQTLVWCRVRVCAKQKVIPGDTGCTVPTLFRNIKSFNSEINFCFDVVTSAYFFGFCTRVNLVKINESIACI